ncbi:hypothetical protein EJ04DRAFT_504871 [Polyplosphaeria fusca]|uniref:NACHT domain-containing protein n=1 Tax=Polyplosphaeria fusca TaxID=682080 RepID=A0A9P4QNC0_9PLEO|nr:hypothetical protein EJ04DRAFT_504871 [Polyplosphaeria fusca]
MRLSWGGLQLCGTFGCGTRLPSSLSLAARLLSVSSQLHLPLPPTASRNDSFRVESTLTGYFSGPQTSPNPWPKSVIAVVQITDRVIHLCKFYLGSLKDVPSEIRVILLEVSTLKAVLENIQFIDNNGGNAIVSRLGGKDGSIEACKRTVAALEDLFPSEHVGQSGNGSKNRKFMMKVSLATLGWPLKEKKAKQLLEEICRYKATFTLVLSTDSTQNIRNIQINTGAIHGLLDQKQRDEVYRWLESTDTSSIYNRACTQYEPGTCEWMLRSQEWADYVGENIRSLWLHGIPGAGKTVLISHLIRKLESYCQDRKDPNRVYAYYYCYFGHNQDETTHVLRSLMNQLCRRKEIVTDLIYQMFKKGSEPTVAELLQALEQVLGHFDNVYFVVDALDECSNRENLLAILRTLATQPGFEKLRILSSSREYIDIKRAMDFIAKPVSMSNEFVQNDIRLHVEALLRSNSKFGRWPQELLSEVTEIVPKQAKRMFRWAVCQLDVLQRLKFDLQIIKDTLQNLPKTLDESYNQIFRSIPEDDRLFVLHALHWTSFHNESSYTRSLGRISGAVLAQMAAKSAAEQCPTYENRHYDVDDLQEQCSCLVRFTLHSEDFSKPRYHATMAHYTVQEYLNPQIYVSISLHLLLYHTVHGN